MPNRLTSSFDSGTRGQRKSHQNGGCWTKLCLFKDSRPKGWQQCSTTKDRYQILLARVATFVFKQLAFQDFDASPGVASGRDFSRSSLATQCRRTTWENRRISKHNIADTVVVKRHAKQHIEFPWLHIGGGPDIIEHDQRRTTPKIVPPNCMFLARCSCG